MNAQDILNDSDDFKLSESELIELRQLQTEHNISKCLKELRK